MLLVLGWAYVVKFLLKLSETTDAEVIKAIPVPAFFEVDHKGTVNPVTVNSLSVRALIVN